MNLSHRMDRKHEQAANQAAAARPADLPDLPKGAEEWFAAKMRSPDAKVSQVASRLKHHKCGQRTGTAAMVLAVISAAEQPITAKQIAQRIDRSSEAIRHCLKRLHERDVVQKHGPANKLKWSKV